MTTSANPAFAAFLNALGSEASFCQVFISRGASGFSLRHVDDQNHSVDSLRSIPLAELRALAQFSADGVFRPLKSAPNLVRGWRADLGDENELWLALNSFYPGAVADWFAAQSSAPPVTNYRDFTARQTGMYRITAALDDLPARAAIAACCHEDFCLKRRLWSIGGLAPDAPEKKSAIPCLEPCAVMLEFARKVARWEQGIDAPESTNTSSDSSVAECDFDAQNNPRRVRFVLEKQSVAAT